MGKYLLALFALGLAVSARPAFASAPAGETAASAKDVLRSTFARAKTLQPADFPAFFDELVARLKEKNPEFAFAYSSLAGNPPFPEGSPHHEAWRRFVRSTLETALASPALSPELREIYRAIELALVFSENAGKAPSPESHLRLQAAVETLAAAYPDNPVVEAFATVEMFGLVYSDPRQADGWAAKLAQSASPGLAKVGRGRMATLAGRTQPVEARFTALDGREVDLAKLRGKVVLLDFWATWCGPCVAELPNVKRVYEAYRDKGFEVIGVTLEKASFKPDDTPAIRQEKLAAARQKLADYVAGKGVTWPQKLEGDFGSELVARYNIAAIPATILLDRKGLVTNDAILRDKELETAVKNLLGL